MKDQAAIAGIGQTRFGKGFEETEEALACMAVKAALDDAGLRPSDVDGICSYTLQGMGEDDLARDMGFRDIQFFSRAPAGGGGGCATIGHAAMAVATGQAEVVVAYRSRKRSAHASRMWAQGAQDLARENWLVPYGIVRPADDVALLARRYMHEFGATREQLADVALAARRHANLNPAAVMFAKPMTREDYLAARMISDPLCLFDCCLETDGALAVIVTSAERARDLRQTPALIHAFAQGFTSGSGTMAQFYTEDPLHTQAWACAQALWRRSDLKPADMKTAQIYDAFTPEVWFNLEAYGFCGRGEAAAFTAGGTLEIGGALPFNTAGGGLSEAYVHGFNLILEAVRQLRGTSTAQVAGADAAFVCSSDLVPTGALVLRT